MKSYKVRLTNQAISDWALIIDDIAENNARYAVSINTKIEKRIDSLETFPRRYPVFLESSEIRVTYIHAYAIFYEVDVEFSSVTVVRILTARFGSEKLGKLLAK